MFLSRIKYMMLSTEEQRRHGPYHKKTCLWGLTRSGSNQPAQLKRLARILKFCLELVLLLYFPDSELGWSEPLLFACNKVGFSCV